MKTLTTVSLIFVLLSLASHAYALDAFDEYQNAFGKGLALGVAVGFYLFVKITSRKIRGTILFGRLKNKLSTSSFLKNANQNTIKRILLWFSHISAFVVCYTFLGIVVIFLDFLFFQ